MNEPDAFEQELQRFRPVPPPDPLRNRLEAIPDTPASVPARAGSRAGPNLLLWLRWLAPISAAAAVAWFTIVALKPDRPTAPADEVTDTPGLRADSVQIDRQLVAAYDAIARLPDGEPVRVYCQEWVDEVELRDTTRGVAVRQRTPRVEIIPIRLETF